MVIILKRFKLILSAGKLKIPINVPKIMNLFKRLSFFDILMGVGWYSSELEDLMSRKEVTEAIINFIIKT